jgi:hypothetical protein
MRSSEQCKNKFLHSVLFLAIKNHPNPVLRFAMLPVPEYDDPSPGNNYHVGLGSIQWDPEEICGQPGALRCHYWQNPDVRLSIQKAFQPYHPYDNRELKLNFEEKIKFINHLQMDFYFLNETKNEVLTPIYIHLDINDLANLSKVSKCCYLATKSDYIWKIQLNKLLPHVKLLPLSACSFTPEQQFQIIFEKMKTRIKPFTTQLNYYHQRVVKIEEIIGKYNILRKNKNDNRPVCIIITNYIHLLEMELKTYVGPNYNGHPESIDPNSSQSKCLAALTLIPKQEFDIQENFKNMILWVKTLSDFRYTQDASKVGR